MPWVKNAASQLRSSYMGIQIVFTSSSLIDRYSCDVTAVGAEDGSGKNVQDANQSFRDLLAFAPMSFIIGTGVLWFTLQMKRMCRAGGWQNSTKKFKS